MINFNLIKEKFLLVAKIHNYKEAKKFTNKQVKQLIEAFTGKHQSISKYFCSDSGVMFMSLDGAITAKVVNTSQI